jgi:hypothetical protein
MVYYQTKNPNLGKFWSVLQWKRLLYFMASSSILQTFDIIHVHLEYLLFLCIFSPVLVRISDKNLATLASTEFLQYSETFLYTCTIAKK